MRKVEPFARAIAGAGAWVTGVRREQSSRARRRNRWKSIPPMAASRASVRMLDWTHEDVWDYIRANKLPYNPLHDQGYPSIGCAPCTRAVEPGDDSRSGRWWWENSDSKECGLQPRVRTPPPRRLIAARMDYLPIFVDLRERLVVVVGGGVVAARKVEQLLKAHARVRVVAPELCAELAASPRPGAHRVPAAAVLRAAAGWRVAGHRGHR